MRHHSSVHVHARPDHFAALFVDYDNLYSYFSQRLGDAPAAESCISELIEALRRHLQREEHTSTALTLAYADFDAVDGGPVQRALCLLEAEPRFVPAGLQPNASELQLCMDAMDLLRDRPDVGTLVVLTGNRAYLPLLHRGRRYGRRVMLASLERPAALDVCGLRDVYFDAASLLNEQVRRTVLTAAQAPCTEAASPAQTPYAEPALAGRYGDVKDPILLRTLEVIEEYFGQYDEVYLTPLLRKLSELFDERQYDPKALISELEKASAVRLEKRRGFPYDYTVLIVNTAHPDVQRIHQAFFERTGRDDNEDDDAYYDEDEYNDDAYDFSDDDYETDILDRGPAHDRDEREDAGWGEARH